MILKTILPLVISFIVANPGENASRQINIGWHCPEQGSYLELTVAGDTAFIHPTLFSPVEKYWNCPEGDALMQQPRYVCSVALNRLKPDFKYIYRIVSGTERSSIRSFRTAPTGSRFKIMAFTDFQPAFNAKTPKLIERIRETAPDAGLAVCSGDMTDYGSREAEWKWFFESASPVLESSVYAASPGDHEYWGHRMDNGHISQMETPAGYNAVFNFPQNGVRCSRNSNYFFHWGSVLVVSLDFDDSNTVSSDKISDQVKWLKANVPALKGSYDYLVVIAHKSLVSSYTNDAGVARTLRPLYQPVLEELGADLVISGHDHMYSRTKCLNGTYYLDLGSSGTKARIPDEGIAADGMHELVLDLKTSQQCLGAVLSVERRRMTVTVYDFSGIPVDSFTINRK